MVGDSCSRSICKVPSLPPAASSTLYSASRLPWKYILKSKECVRNSSRETGSTVGVREKPEVPCKCFCLWPSSRQELYRKLDYRCETMISPEFLTEVCATLPTEKETKTSSNNRLVPPSPFSLSLPLEEREGGAIEITSKGKACLLSNTIVIRQLAYSIIR